MGVICNLLLILLIIIDPLRNLHHGAWIIILNISIADFIATGAHFAKLFIYLIKQDENLTLLTSSILSFFWMFGVGASFMLLTLLNMQIYVIIKYPIKSRIIVTTKRIIFCCIFGWIFAVGMGLLNIGYYWIEDINYVHIARITGLEVAVAFQVLLKILTTVEMLRSRDNMLHAQTLNKKHKDVAKTVIILNVILIITAFPYFLAKQIEFISRLDEQDEFTEWSNKDLLLRKFSYYYEPIALLNFVVNPVVYSLRLKNYRQSLIALFHFKCKKRKFNGRSKRKSLTLTNTSKDDSNIRESLV